VIIGAVQSAYGQPHTVIFLGAAVAAIGHYNDSIRDVHL